MSPRLPALAGRPIGFGLRGTVGDARANTLESFRQALALDATGIASDVWLTADGVPVLDGDGRIGPRLRRRPIGALTAAELPDGLATLTELLDLAGTGVPLSLDVRDTSALEPVLAAVRRREAGAETDLWLCHPDLDVLTDWRPRTSARLVNTSRASSPEGGLERRAAELEQRGIDALDLDHKEWSGGRIALLHRFGRLALGRGPVHEREVAALVDAGIDAVYSDRVDRMMAVIREYYGPPEVTGSG